jgi:L-ascorbate metabolism protein UlaG (beta-lactamase superfamily)
MTPSLTLIRHATLLLEVGGRRLLVDPMLRAAGSTPPIEGTPNPVRNPLVELPLPVAAVVAGVDGCIVTHLHADHFDDAADEALPRDLPILTQPASVAALRERGLTQVTDEPAGWLGLDVVRTGGRHGTGELADRLGPVSGFVVEGVYVAGDTVWCDEVADALAAHRPHTVVVNAGGARFLEGDPITMTADDVRRVREATAAEVVVVHLEAINHCLEPRSAYAELEVHVPADGETVAPAPSGA